MSRFTLQQFVDAGLGVLSDRAVARQLGCTVPAVAYRRKVNNLPSPSGHVAGEAGSRMLILTKEERRRLFNWLDGLIQDFGEDDFVGDMPQMKSVHAKLRAL